MEQYFALGLFSLYVVLVSLLRLLPDGNLPYMRGAKKSLGRTRGMAFCFVCQVVVPLLLGIIFLSRGIAGVAAGTFTPPHLPFPHNQVLVYLCCAPSLLRTEIGPAEVSANGEIPLLLAEADKE